MNLVAISLMIVPPLPYREQVVFKVEQDPLPLERVDAKNAIGPNDIGAQKRHNRFAESSMADAHPVKTDGINQQRASNARYGMLRTHCQTKSPDHAISQHGVLRTCVDEELKWSLRPDIDRYCKTLISVTRNRNDLWNGRHRSNG